MGQYKDTTGLPKAARLFAQIPLIVYELRLLNKLSKVDRLVLDSMLYHTTRRKRGAPDSGACCVMTSIILREHKGTGLRWATQVERSMARIEKLGLYKRRGYRWVGTVSVRLFYQATGAEVWQHAREHGLIPKGWAEEQALREHQRRERAEAARLEAANRGVVESREQAQHRVEAEDRAEVSDCRVEPRPSWPASLDAEFDRALRGRS